MRHRIFDWLGRQPVLSSLLIGGGLFAVASTIRPAPYGEIVLDGRTVTSVVEERANGRGRNLTADERQEAIAAYVEEEVLLREAFRSGRHLTNGSARARLAQRMRLSLNAEIPQPTDAQLRAWYAANPDRYRTADAVTLAHVFYGRPDDVSPSPATPDPTAALEAGADFRTLGERFWLGSVLSAQTEAQIGGALGTEFAAEVFALPTGEWSGAIESTRGIHFVRILERHPPFVPAFELVREAVELDWLNERRIEVTDRKLARVMSRYDVVVEGSE